MAGEVNLDIKVTGLGDLKRQLKEAKDEMIAISSQPIIDPAKLEAATAKAGKLKDMMADANEQIGIMSGGSQFEKISSGLGLISGQLMNMDFEGASESAGKLTSTIKAMDPKTIMAGFKGLITTVTQLSSAFVSMGVSLLANPIFLIAAIIVAVVVAIVLLKDKLKIAEQAFNMMMVPIKLLIQAMKDLTDAIGLTSFAEEEAAEKSLEATNKRIAAAQKMTDTMDKEYGRQIALAKANGQDTTKLETQQAAARQNASAKNVNDLNSTIKQQSDLLKGQTQEQQKETRKTIADLAKQRDEEVQINKDSANQIGVIKGNANKDAAAKQKTANESASTEAKKAAADALEAKKRAIDVERIVENSRISTIEDTYLREKAMNEEKRLEQVKDLDFSKYTAEQKIELIKVYATQKEQADKKSLEDEKKRNADLKKENEDYRQKELAIIKEHEDNLKASKANYDAYILEHSKDELKKELGAIEASRTEQQGLEQLRYFREQTAAKGNQAELFRLKLEHLKRMKEIDGIAEVESADATKLKHEKDLKDTGDHYVQVGQMVAGLAGTINDALNSLDADRLNKINEKHSAEITSIDNKRQQELAVVGLTEVQKKAINEKADKAKYDADVKAWQATEKIKKEQFARDKAMRMVNVVMDTAAGIMAGYKNGPIIGSALSIITLAQGAIQLAAIAAQKYQGSPGPAAPSLSPGGGGGGASEALTPSWVPTKTSQDNTTGMAASANAGQNITVTAIVSETQVTDSQTRVAKMQKSAEL